MILRVRTYRLDSHEPRVSGATANGAGTPPRPLTDGTGETSGASTLTTAVAAAR